MRLAEHVACIGDVERREDFDGETERNSKGGRVLD